MVLSLSLKSIDCGIRFIKDYLDHVYNDIRIYKYRTGISASTSQSFQTNEAPFTIHDGQISPAREERTCEDDLRFIFRFSMSL